MKPNIGSSLKPIFWINLGLISFIFYKVLTIWTGTDTGIETFDILSDVKDLKKDFANVGKAAEKIPGQLDDLSKTMDKVGNQVENIEGQIETIVTKKLGKAITQFGDIINEGIVEPIGTLFEAIGNVFVQFAEIMVKIGNKIGSIQKCSFEYFVVSFKSAMGQLLPDFITTPISEVYKASGMADSDWGGIWDERCLKFDVKDEVKSVNDGFRDATKNFKRKFGKMDFNQIKF